jgi:hypothetical protein
MIFSLTQEKNIIRGIRVLRKKSYLKKTMNADKSFPTNRLGVLLDVVVALGKRGSSRGGGGSGGNGATTAGGGRA